MPGSKEIRVKIRSVQNTRKITKAMEMVAASKMRKAQDRMRAARPYGEKMRNVAAHMSQATAEYRHPFLVKRPEVRNVGVILVTSDKGLCGGLNTNVLRLSLAKIKELEAANVGVQVCAFGGKGFGFMQRIGANVVSHVTGLGDTPRLERLIGAVKVIIDAYNEGKIDALYLLYTRFINTMKQEPNLEQILPLTDKLGTTEPAQETQRVPWDYLYEPDPKTVVDAVLVRYLEALIYQAIVENFASEQSARMVAMKAASDNAATIIDELQLVYNKARQAAITKEISEIVGGAAAVSS